jgi:hypothetical protein
LQPVHILAATPVPVAFGKFHLPPPWTIVFVASVVLLYLTLFIEGRMNRPSGTMQTILHALELGFMTSAIVGVATTPLFDSLRGGFVVALDALHNWSFLSKFSVGILLFGILLLAGWRFTKAEDVSWIWGAVFGLAMLTFATTTPAVVSLLEFLINNIVAPLWNGLLGLLTVLFNIHFTVSK